MEQYYLGFDAGTQSVKTAVYDIDKQTPDNRGAAPFSNRHRACCISARQDKFLLSTDDPANRQFAAWLICRTPTVPAKQRFPPA